MKSESTIYITKPGDLAIVPFSESQIPRIYRVESIRLGGVGEDGHVEVHAVGMVANTFHIPIIVWEQGVAHGSIRIVWREGQCF